MVFIKYGEWRRDVGEDMDGWSQYEGLFVFSVCVGGVVDVHRLDKQYGTDPC